MREAPFWFQNELTRIGGVNPYDEPIFKLVWATTERRLVGGRFQDGFEGYRQMRGVPGEPCWALMVWEPREMQGTLSRWELEYQDPETGLLDCGGYPKYGAYRLLQRFIHREIVRQHKEHHYMTRSGEPRTEHLQSEEVVTYRMEPGGFLLDIMIPLLMNWRRLTDEAKRMALVEEERAKNEEVLKMAKDLRQACRVNRGSRLVQERAAIIERGFRQAMAMAAQTGLGMRIAA